MKDNIYNLCKYYINYAASSFASFDMKIYVFILRELGGKKTTLFEPSVPVSRINPWLLVGCKKSKLLLTLPYHVCWFTHSKNWNPGIIKGYEAGLGRWKICAIPTMHQP